MTFNLLVWLFAVSITIHNLEEAIWLPGWEPNICRLKIKTGPLEFRFAVSVLTLLAYLAATLAMIGGRGSVGAYLISGYALAMLINVFVPHLLATIITKRYAPGTATAIVLNLPVTILLLRQGFREGVIDTSTFLTAGPLSALGILLLLPILFFIGRRIRPSS